MPYLNKDIPVIVVSSSILIFLFFLISIAYNIEIVVALMFVMPITVISSTGMVVSYKHKVTEDARSRDILPLRKKSIKQVAQREKSISLKEIPKSERIRIPKKPPKGVAKKPKKETLTEQVQQQLTQAELEEIKKTESEMDIEKQKVTCIVHKGPIEGNLYLCPHCKTFYCAKCAKTLKEKGEECWSCGKELDKPKEISQEQQKRLNSLNSLVSHYKIRLNALENRYRFKKEREDKLKFYEEKEKLMKDLERHTGYLEKYKRSLDLD